MKTIAILAGVLFLAATTHAQTASPAEQRLREQVKSLTMRLNTAETAQATLTAEKTELEGKLKTLEKAFADLTKQMESDKKVAKEEVEKLNADIAAKNVEISQTKDLLVKADAFGKQADASYKKAEDERVKLVDERKQLKEVVTRQRANNAKMFEIATEVLGRYQKFGLGTALTAREPFVGITRARLETMVEEYGGKISEQRIRVDGTTKPAPAPAAKDRPADGKPGTKEKKPAAAKP